MIELLVIWLAGFCIGVAIVIVALWLSSPKGNYRPHRPEQPLAADLIRYTRWRDEQIRRAVTEPIRFDEGPIARNNSGGPTTPKPAIVPKPQFPSPRVIPGDTP